MSASPLKPLMRPSPSSRVQSTSSSFAITPLGAGPSAPGGSMTGEDGRDGRDRSSSAMASSSASSSQMVGQQQPNRADQIVYRFYLKTVGVLVEGRLTHYGGSKGGEKKKDKWFNLCLPETDLHKADLQMYRTVSTYPPLSQSQQQSLPGSNPCSVPPLLVAFILDTSDIPNGQTLIWNKDGGKVRLDPSLIKSTRDGRRPGIVLERWTFTANYPPSTVPSSSQLPPHTAYRIGIIHFRALFALMRLLPAFRLHRRLRRANNGLRLGIKLWGADGIPNSTEGLDEAWEIMERDLVGLDIALEQMIPGQDQPQPSDPEKFNFAPLDLFGLRYDLSVDYRPDVDFQVEDMESVLSEKFVDMDEEWFTPTVARHRLQEVQAGASDAAPIQAGTPTGGVVRPMRSTSSGTSVGMPFPSPIPQRQPGVAVGSLGAAGGSVSRPSGSRVSSATVNAQGSLGAGKWGALAEGLPFAAAAPSGQSGSGSAIREPASPGSVNTSGAAITARRLSAHSLQPFRSSPSASILRSQNPPLVQGQHQAPSARPIGSSRPSSSIGRTSSFLSQSGRSFTHAQMANMYPSSASPPITGALSSHAQRAASPTQNQPSPISPSSLTFSKQHFPRGFTGRPAYMTPSSSSPFIPSSLDRESSGLASPVPPSGSQMGKRYSSSLSQRRALSGSAGSSGGATPAGGLQVSGGEGSSLPGSAGASGGVLGQYNLLRRTSTRESGLRHSLEDPAIPDGDDIQAFLKTLDAWGPPPSSLVRSSLGSVPHRSDLVAPHSISSSLSGGPSGTHSPSPLVVSSTESPASASVNAQQPVTEDMPRNADVPVITTRAPSLGPGPTSRAPLTRAHVDDMLKRMMGSFSIDDTGGNGSSRISPSIPSSPRSRASPAPAPLSLAPVTGGGVALPSTYGLLSASRPSGAPSAMQRGASSGLRHSTSGGALAQALARSRSPAVRPPSIQTAALNTPPSSRYPVSGGGVERMTPSPSPAQQQDLEQQQHQQHPSQQQPTARSLPGIAAPLSQDAPPPLRSGPTPSVPVAIAQHLSPQTTGGTTGFGSFGTAPTTASAGTTPSDAAGVGFGLGGRRRGPVLVRGGFGAPSVSSKASTSSSSPSHSPIRDFSRLSTRPVRPGMGGVSVGVGSGAAQSLGQAVDDEMGWKLGRTRDRLSTPPVSGGLGVGAGGGYGYPVSAGMGHQHSHSSSMGAASGLSTGQGQQGHGQGQYAQTGRQVGPGVNAVRSRSGPRGVASGPSSLGGSGSGRGGVNDDDEADDADGEGEGEGAGTEEDAVRGRARAGRAVASEGDEGRAGYGYTTTGGDGGGGVGKLARLGLPDE